MMKNIFKIVFSALALSFAACAPESTETPEVVEPQVLLNVSETSVTVGPDSYVDFMVKYDGKNVTKSARIYSEVNGKSVRVDAHYLIEELRDYTFYATYNNMTSEKVSVEGELDLILAPDASAVVVGDDAVVDVKVLASGTDVTSESKIYHRMVGESRGEAEELADTTFPMSELGEHLFFAEYCGFASGDFLVYGVDKMIDKVADSNPDKFDSFVRNLLVIQATSTQCTWCPHMTKAFEESMEEMPELAKNTIHTAVHGVLDAESDDADPMYCPASTKIIDGMGFNTIGYPALNFGMSSAAGFTLQNPGSPSDNNGKVEAIKEKIKPIVASLLETPAACAISASSVIEGDIISMRADVKVGVEGEYRIGAWIIEDGIEAQQTNANAFPDYDFSVHNNAVCATFPSLESVDLFAYLGSVKSQAAGSEHMLYCEFNLASFETIQDIDNCEIVVFVYNALTSSVDNAITLEIGGKSEIIYQ